MALTATQTTQIFEIYGLPQGGAAAVVHGATSLWGPYFESYDVSTLVTKLNASITALTSTQESEVTALLTAYFTTIGDSSQLKVYADGTTSGTLVDRPAELSYYRNKLSNILGFYMVPISTEISRRRGMGGVISH